MANARDRRRLAAILSADVVGYSRLMGVDESGTLAQLKALRKELIDPKIAEYGGRIVKTTGDGILIEFSSVIDAVQMAVEVQRDMGRRNEAVPEDRRIVYRVGINQGDIIVDGDDIHGDGVNVAARLEAMAEPGGICISRKVRDEIRDKLPYALEDLGEVEVKNIARPVRAFRVSLDEAGAPRSVTTKPAAGKASPARGRRAWLFPAIAAAVVLIAVVGGGAAWWQPWVTRVEAANVANMAFPLPDKPSIAVLPFVNLSGDPDQEFIADGMSEDITTALSKLPSLFVISRTTTQTYKGRTITVGEVAEELGVQYVLEGSVQRDGDRLRVNAQLIDALNGLHIWAERFDGDVNDLFAVKDNIALNVASNVGAKLEQGDFALLARRETNSLDAWLLWRQAQVLHETFTPEGLIKARDLYQRAAAIDPEFLTPQVGAADTFRAEAQFGYTEDAQAALARGTELVEQVLERDPAHAFAYAIKSSLLNAGGDYAESVDAGSHAVALDPNNWVNQGVLGWTLLAVGRYEESAYHMSLAQRLSPVHGDWIENILGLAQFLAGDPEQALATFDALLERNPSAAREAIAQPRIALILYALSREQEAKEAIDRTRALNPKMSIGLQTSVVPIQDRDIRSKWIETWRRLGLPE